MALGQPTELLIEDHVVDVAVHVDQVETMRQSTIKDVQQDTARRSTAGTAGEEHQVVAVEQRIVMKSAHRAGTEEALACFHMIQQVVRDEAVLRPLHGQVVVDPL
ncbi:hypothetical protein D9M70_514650 [compost metagenome]